MSSGAEKTLISNGNGQLFFSFIFFNAWQKAETQEFSIDTVLGIRAKVKRIKAYSAITG